MSMDDTEPEHDLHVLTVDDYNERGSYGTILLCSCGESVGIDGTAWEYADTLACLHLGYYDVPRPDIIDEVFAEMAADRAIVAAAKAWGQAKRSIKETHRRIRQEDGDDAFQAHEQAWTDYRHAEVAMFALVDPGEG